MREITVNYVLSDEYEERLTQIQEAYQSHGLEMTIEEMFEFIMTTGCVMDIDRRLRMHEDMAQQWQKERMQNG